MESTNGGNIIGFSGSSVVPNTYESTSISKRHHLKVKFPHLVDHIPVESIEHVLPVVMRLAQLRPKLRADRRIHRPGILADQQFHLTLLALLNETIDVVERLERLLFRCK